MSVAQLILRLRADRVHRSAAVPLAGGGHRAEGARQRHAAPQRGAGLQHSAGARGRALYEQQAALVRRPVLAELRRGGRTVRQHAELLRFLLGGHGEQSGTGVPAVPERGDIGL